MIFFTHTPGILAMNKSCLVRFCNVLADIIYARLCYIYYYFVCMSHVEICKLCNCMYLFQTLCDLTLSQTPPISVPLVIPQCVVELVIKSIFFLLMFAKFIRCTCLPLSHLRFTNAPYVLSAIIS